jgi:hypothetical protein
MDQVIKVKFSFPCSQSHEMQEIGGVVTLDLSLVPNVRIPPRNPKVTTLYRCS